MQKEDSNRDNAWAEALEELRSEDVAPGWKSGIVWQRVQSGINSKRRIPVFIYPLAVAASLLMAFIFLWPANEHKSAPQQQLTASKPDFNPVQATKKDLASTPRPASNPATATSASPKKHAPAVIDLKRQTAVAMEVTQVSTFISKDTTPAHVVDPHSNYTYHRQPEVVYTLNEIMADIPEREEPPKRYSGIFHGGSPADAHGGGPSRRRSEEPAYKLPEPSPIIN